jgi:hypothetical protein
MWTPKITNKVNNVYKPKLVKLKLKNPKIGALKPIKLLTSNWLRGDKINDDENINIWYITHCLIFIFVFIINL